MAHELRCDNGILFARLGDGTIEVKCRSRRCGYERGVVVLHFFDAQTGELKRSELYKDPSVNQKEVREDGRNAALRAS